MTFKKSLLIALFSFGIAQSAVAETDSDSDSEKFNRAFQFAKQENYSAAFPLFKQLAEQGDAKAQFNLGLMYYEGKGVRRDVSKAKQLFGQACDNGESNGCENYSILDKQGVH